MDHRIDRMESLIKEEISLIFLHDLHEPEYGFITVTNVKLTHDFRLATIYLSILDKEKREEILERVKSKTGLIRKELAGRIRIKFIPELRFFIDDTQDYVEKIEGLIKKIHEDDDNE